MTSGIVDKTRREDLYIKVPMVNLSCLMLFKFLPFTCLSGSVAYDNVLVMVVMGLRRGSAGLRCPDILIVSCDSLEA